MLDHINHHNCFIGCHASASEVISLNPKAYRNGPLHEVSARTPLCTKKAYIHLVGSVCRICDLEPHLLSPDYVRLNGGPREAGVQSILCNLLIDLIVSLLQRLGLLTFLSKNSPP